jgi:Ca2+-binding EF-hand superfamily protein
MQRRASEGRPMGGGAAGAPTFADFDADGDGKITPEEFEAGQARHREMRDATRQGQGAGQGMGRGRDRPRFEDFDLDGDGFIAEQEFIDFRNQRISERVVQGYPMKRLAEAPTFEELDLDGDGKLSREEFEAHQAQRRQSDPP